jgi:hypothetical membrane protein
MRTRGLFDRVVHGVAAVGPLLFFAVATVEGSIRAGYDPIAQPISALALGPRGWIQELNFALLAASFLSLAVVWRTSLRGDRASVAGPGLFVLLTIGVMLAGIFPMDARGAPPTLVGRLHTAGGFLVFPWIPVVLLVLARRFRRDPGWRPFFGYTLATGLFCLATLTFFLLFVGPPGSSPRIATGLAGLVQRLLLLPFFAWTALSSRRAYHLLALHPASPTFRAGADVDEAQLLITGRRT